MDQYESNKRLKSASGAPVSASRPIPNIPQYQPPAPIGSGPKPAASIARPPNSLRLTVKAPPSKLRQATSGSQIPPNPYADAADESDTTPAPATSRTARTTRNPRTVVEPESEEDEEMEDAQGEEDDAEGEDDEVDQELKDMEDSEEDAEGDEDDIDEHPPPPIIKQRSDPKTGKPNVTITAPPEGPLKSVEAKEMEGEDEEELSELESGDENTELREGEEDEEDEDEDSNSDDLSRSATPDLSKLTRRQRGMYQEEGGLLALSNEAMKKKHLTAEEHAMRRQEMARRRKNLSEKRNEEEKMDTINKLLKKPAAKRRTRAEIIRDQQMEAMSTPGYDEDGNEGPRADPFFTRWVSTSKGLKLGVPDEWLETPAGTPFVRDSAGSANGSLVQEVA